MPMPKQEPQLVQQLGLQQEQQRQQQEQEQELGRQQVQPFQSERPVLVQVLELLLFCRKQPEQQPTGR